MFYGFNLKLITMHIPLLYFRNQPLALNAPPKFLPLISEKCCCSCVTKAQISQAPILLNSSHLRVVIISSAIRFPMRGRGHSITQKYRINPISPRLTPRFIES